MKGVCICGFYVCWELASDFMKYPTSAMPFHQYLAQPRILPHFLYNFHGPVHALSHYLIPFTQLQLVGCTPFVVNITKQLEDTVCMCPGIFGQLGRINIEKATFYFIEELHIILYSDNTLINSVAQFRTQVEKDRRHSVNAFLLMAQHDGGNFPIVFQPFQSTNQFFDTILIIAMTKYFCTPFYFFIISLSIHRLFATNLYHNLQCFFLMSDLDRESELDQSNASFFMSDEKSNRKKASVTMPPNEQISEIAGKVPFNSEEKVTVFDRNLFIQPQMPWKNGFFPGQDGAENYKVRQQNAQKSKGISNNQKYITLDTPYHEVNGYIQSRFVKKIEYLPEKSSVSKKFYSPRNNNYNRKYNDYNAKDKDNRFKYRTKSPNRYQIKSPKPKLYKEKPKLDEKASQKKKIRYVLKQKTHFQQKQLQKKQLKSTNLIPEQIFHKKDETSITEIKPLDIGKENKEKQTKVPEKQKEQNEVQYQDKLKVQAQNNQKNEETLDIFHQCSTEQTNLDQEDSQKMLENDEKEEEKKNQKLYKYTIYIDYQNCCVMKLKQVVRGEKVIKVGKHINDNNLTLIEKTKDFGIETGKAIWELAYSTEQVSINKIKAQCGNCGNIEEYYFRNRSIGAICFKCTQVILIEVTKTDVQEI